MKGMPYCAYNHDYLETADRMRIERCIYFQNDDYSVSELIVLPLAKLIAMRRESAEAEREIYDWLKEQASAWEKQAGKTLLLDKAIKYLQTPSPKHTANQWEEADRYRHERSNAVYRMTYVISENTRYDDKTQKSIPCSWSLRWGVYTNAPRICQQAKIAGQEHKVFASRETMNKYLCGRIKAYQHLFTEIFPPIPPEYAECFKVSGCLLPGYQIDGQQDRHEHHRVDWKKSSPTCQDPNQI